MNKKPRTSTNCHPPNHNDPHTAESLLSEPEAARLLGISARTLWSLRKSGAISVIRIHSRVLYSHEDLERFIAANRIQSAESSDGSVKGVTRG